MKHLRQFLCLVLLVSGAFGAQAQDKTLTVSGVPIVLRDVTAQAEVFFSGMRFNRASNVWNVEVTVRNNSVLPIAVPLVLYVESWSGTQGLMNPDGLDATKPYFDLAGYVSNNTLAAGESTAPRTLTLRSGSGTPSISARVYSQVLPAAAAITFARSLNDVGQPLPDVIVEEIGPDGSKTNSTDNVNGVATLGGRTGSHLWKFSKPGYLPVWRSLTLTTNGVVSLPSPRLTPRAPSQFTLSPLSGVAYSNQFLALQFGPGSVIGQTAGTITPLDGQTLPALLPLGWSPLNAFWFETATPLQQPGTILIVPNDRIGFSETAALVRWNETLARWDVLETKSGLGTNALSFVLPGTGAFAFVVPDNGIFAPPAAVSGQPLAGSANSFTNFGSVTALGTVTPSLSPASKVPEMVTASAEVTFTNSNGALPSGLLLRTEVSERYELADHSVRVTPGYENHVVAYQRPSDDNVATLTARFLLRPQLLLGSDELAQANVHVDVFPPEGFSGVVLDQNGGQISVGPVRILSGVSNLNSQFALKLQLLNVTNFNSLASNIVVAFEISAGKLPEGRRLNVQFSNQAANSFFVLARILSRDGLYGLEPVERFASDASGKLISVEPESGARLPGITGAGQFVLIQVGVPQGVIAGVARDAQNQPLAGAVIRIPPWMTFSDIEGQYRLLAPTGAVQVAITDLNTGDSTQLDVQLADWQAGLVTDIGAAPQPPFVVSVSPTNNASGVSIVTPITITFSEPINLGTVLPDGIQLIGASNEVVAATLSFNLKGTVATLLPVDPLTALTDHVIVVSTNVADLTGLKLTGANTFSFRTATGSAQRDLAAQVISYEPTNGVMRIQGTVGIAEPHAPVVLVNETTGHTTTVLAKADGSFDGSIRAEVDDRINAVFVNGNGSRDVISVSRQIFADGSVGLFNGGGIIETPSPNGPVQLIVEPGSVPNKVVIKAEYMAPTDFPTNVINTPPEGEGSRLLAGVKITGRGDEPTQGIDFSIPVKLEDLGLPEGVHPTNASYALVIPRTYVDEETGATNTAYEILDRMQYEDGRLVTHSPPFLGLLVVGIIGETAVYAAVQSTGGNIALSGYVVAGKASNNREGFERGTERYLPGATIVYVPPNLSVNRPGALRPGTYYATAYGTNAHFSTLVPVYSSGAAAIWATHPRFPGQWSQPFIVPMLSPNERVLLGNLLFPTWLVFPLTTGNELDDHTPPTLTFSHAPDSPQPGTNMLRVLSRDDGSRPNIAVTVENVSSLIGGTNLDLSIISLTKTNTEEVGLFGRRDYFEVVCPVAAKVDFKAVSRDDSGNERTGLYSMLIGGSPASATNQIPVVDPNDKTGPVVIRSTPSRGSRGLPPGQPIVLRFDEPIDRAILGTPSAILMSPAAGHPELHLSPDQLELTVFFHNLLPDQDYTLTLTSEIRDLAGNRLDQNPTVPGNDSFELAFHTAALPSANLPGLITGGGGVVRGVYAYVLERGGNRPGVKVYDLSNPSAPVKISEVYLPGGYPRDLVLIPNYSFKTNVNGQALTRDLLAVVGGYVGEGRNQYLRVFDISDPYNLQRVAGAVLNYDPSAVASRVQWSAPMLDYLENATLSTIGEVNLQEMIIADFLTLNDWNDMPENGRPGIDANGDGDFVDEGDQLPLPARVSPDFAGRSGIYSLGDTDQWINDFAMGKGGDFLGVVVDPGKLLIDNTPVPAAYRTLIADGRVLIREAASYEYPNARPKRVSFVLDYPLNVNGILTPTHFAIISIRMNSDAEDGKPNRITVLDITDPEDIQFVTEIVIPAANGTGVFGVTRREDGLLMAATDKDILLLDPARFYSKLSSDPNAAHPAIVGVIPDAGETMRTFDGNLAGLHIVSSGGKNVVLQSAPTIEVVAFPETTPFNPRELVNTTRTNIEARFSFMQKVATLPPARFKGEPGVIDSTISPPDGHNHFYAIVHAPGSAGEFIELGIESLNWAGNPLPKKGFLFPPINALSDSALSGLGQTPAATDAPTRSCRAWRLSDNPGSPYYNMYLSRPFALVAEEMSIADLALAKNELDREILWAGDYVRVSIDPSMANNPVIGKYAGEINGRERVNMPGVETILPTHPADYLQSQNPGPIAGGASLPLAMNALNAHNGEMNVNLECLNLPGRRLPVVFRMNYSGQSLYEGAFGRGWDFNYNQRVEELNEAIFPEGTKIPLVIRDTPANSEIAQSKDIIFHTGAGRKIIYRYAGTNALAEIGADPLVAELGWTNTAARYYLPPDGLFNFFVKFKDGRFARLDVDGTQHWYNPAGKLQKVYDRYPENSLEMVYGRRGELIQIKDEIRRPIDIGYYRTANDPEFRAGIDQIANRAVELGKIHRLADYSKRDLLFFYNEHGLLERREGPKVEVAAEGGFTGRAITRFIYSGTDRPGASAQSLIGVIGADDAGTPVVNATELGSAGRDTVDRVKVANRELSINMSHENTAAAMAQGNASVEIESQDQAKIKHVFDKFGRPIETMFTGTNGAPRVNTSTYYPNGLLRSVSYPEGNSVLYIYDTNNPSLRSRGNLTMVIKSPGPRGGPTLVANTQYDPWYNLAAGIKKDFNDVEATIKLRADHRDVEEIRIGEHVERFEGNEFGLQTKYIGIDGTEQSWTYTEDGFVETFTAGSGGLQLTSRNIYTPIGGSTSDQTKRGLPSSIIDPKGVSMNLVYDEQNRLVRVTRAGVTTEHTYDRNGNEIETSTTVDTNLKLVERRGYNQLGFMTNHIVKDLEIDGGIADKVTTIVPDAFNRTKETILPSGDIHRIAYDHMGNVASYEIVGSYLETYTYDLNGNRISKTIGNATETYEYDGHDRLIKTITPVGTVTEVTYDNNGNILETQIRDAQDRLLSRSETTYDELNRPLTMKHHRDDGVSEVKYEYNSAQRSVTVTDPLGAKVTTLYDAVGRPEVVITGTHTNRYFYDANDNPEREETEEAGVTYVTRWERNERDHVVRQFDNLGNVTSFGVRLDGANLSVTDRENNTTLRTLSRLGEVLTETSPNNAVKRFIITTNGMLASVKDTVFNGMSYTYSPDGRLLETRLPNNQTITCSDFNALSLAEKSELPRGITMQMTYSPIGKMLTRTVTGLGPARNETYGYDGMQRLISLTDPSGSMEVDYDLAGFLKETRRTYQLTDAPAGLSSIAFAIKQTLDAAGNIATQTYPNDATTVTHRRDVNGRLIGLDPAPGETAVKETKYAGPVRVVERVFGNDRIRVENSYDGLRRVKARKYTRLSDGQALADVRYEFDKNGAQVARQFVHRGGRSDFFGYDGSYRLVRVDQDVRPRLDGALEPIRTIPNFAKPAQVSGLWSAGRFAREVAYTTTDVIESITVFNPDQFQIAPMGTNYDSSDVFRHVPQIDGFVRERDVVGNVTKTRLAVRLPGQTVPQLVEATLTYNDLGQCTKIARVDGVEILNDYDMAGLRIRRRVVGNPALCVPSDIAYIYDGAKLIEERDLNDGRRVIARYFYGDNGDELVAADLATGGSTNLTRHYLLTDVMRSVIAVTDANGTVLERVNYDAWGQPFVQLPDNQRPAVSRVINQTNSLLVVFTESVLPAFESAPVGSNLVTTLRSVNNAFGLERNGSTVSVTVAFEENAPGYPFGSVFRLTPAQALSGNVTLTVNGGAFQDDWNNTNATEVITLNLAGGPQLFTGGAPGSTASGEVSRSLSTFLFHGQVFDFDSGLLYCRARYYDPTTATFLQRDPAGMEDSVNQYAAFANNPINYRDPTGMFAWDPDSWGRELTQIGSQASIREDGLSGYMVGQMINFAGAVLQLGTGFAEGWDLLHSDAQGTFGLLDRYRGAQLVAADVGVAFGAGAAQFSVFKGIGGRVRGYVNSRKQWREFAHNNGLTQMESDAMSLAAREMAEIYNARTVEGGIRRFKKPVQRRQNAERLMANKPGHVLEKTGSDGWVYKDGKFYNSDADFAYLEIDGRPATMAQEEHFGLLVKKHYDELYRKAGYKGTPSSPLQHGMHHHYPDLYNQVVNTHLVDTKKLTAVGHPGDIFSFKLENGRMSGFHKSRWEMHNMLLETEKRFMSRTGNRLPAEWTQMSLHPTIGSIKDAARAGKVFTPKQ